VWARCEVNGGLSQKPQLRVLRVWFLADKGGGTDGFNIFDNRWRQFCNPLGLGLWQRFRFGFGSCGLALANGNQMDQRESGWAGHDAIARKTLREHAKIDELQ
jgi:hypothetical protein